ncbi:MAG: rhomboid family intramembrane serine protease [bacterium]|nr:rhomboid family intramembrane serine protease [bacterium]
MHGTAPDAYSLRGGLVIRSGPERVGEMLLLGGSAPLIMGKQASSDLVLTGDLLSRHHCRLVPTESGWCLEDLQSTNGVTVNGGRVSTHDLADGDDIRVGGFALVYVSDAGIGPFSLPPPESPQVSLPIPVPGAGEPPPISEPIDNETYGVADEVPGLQELADHADRLPAVAPVGETADASVAGGSSRNGDGPPEICPCCRSEYPVRMKICVDCGINLRTGRSILTADGGKLDDIYMAAEGVIRVVSWLVCLGVYPIASEAYGACRPHAVRALAVITVIASVWFLVVGVARPDSMRTTKNYLLWSGDGEPSAEEVLLFYELTFYGDGEAFNERLWELEETHPDMDWDESVLAAHRGLSPEQQYPGQYRSSQLITHAFLHAGIGHLVGNLIFLMVFGSRVNALIGNIPTVVLYPMLAVGAGLAHMASVMEGPPGAMLGASGAIMGLAGMYFVLFPVHQVHMAAWMRLGLLFMFRLHLKLWSVRGFWVVLFYIAFDVIYTALGVEDGTAHWAHLGGFIVGAGLAVILLLTRLINARGGDIISAILGRHAWGLVGAPNRGPGLLQRLP